MYKPLKHSIDVVHVHIAGSPFELISALLYSWTKRKPLIVITMGMLFRYKVVLIYCGSVWVYNFMVKKVLDHANVIIRPSQFYIGESYSREELRKKLGLPT